MNKPVLAEMFDSYFKHGIGDIIVHRSTLAKIRVESKCAPIGAHFASTLTAPPGEIVVERTLVQCHGGVQGFYAVNRVNQQGQQVQFRLAECEVESYDRVIEEAMKLRYPLPAEPSPR